MIRLILTGGQSGVDQAAMNAALAVGLSCGGWCPPGRECDSGTIPDRYPMKETPFERSDKAPNIPRSLRTEWNVRDADAVLVFIPKNINDTGTEWSITCARLYRKEILIVDPFSPDAIQQISNWLQNIHPEILNISGPAERVCPGIYQKVLEIMMKVLTE